MRIGFKINRTPLMAKGYQRYTRPDKALIYTNYLIRAYPKLVYKSKSNDIKNEDCN
jgi:hypothetical protein